MDIRKAIVSLEMGFPLLSLANPWYLNKCGICAVTTPEKRNAAMINNIFFILNKFMPVTESTNPILIYPSVVSIHQFVFAVDHLLHSVRRVSFQVHSLFDAPFAEQLSKEVSETDT